MKQNSLFYGVTFPKPVRRIGLTRFQLVLLVLAAMAWGFVGGFFLNLP